MHEVQRGAGVLRGERGEACRVQIEPHLFQAKVVKVGGVELDPTTTEPLSVCVTLAVGRAGVEQVAVEVRSIRPSRERQTTSLQLTSPGYDVHDAPQSPERQHMKEEGPLGVEV